MYQKTRGWHAPDPSPPQPPCSIPPPRGGARRSLPFTIVPIPRYDVVALPAIDSDGVLLGIVTVDDVLDMAAM